MKIVFDPGHGGQPSLGGDPGAVGHSGTREADVVLLVAHEVKSRMERQHEIVMTRYIDEGITLGRRTVVANQEDADLFISIHCNGFHRPAYGVETYHFPGSVEGEKLAAAIQRELVAETGEVDRGVKTGKFTVLQRTRMPAVLVELPFITTPESEEKLRDPAYLSKCADAIANGIRNYLEG